MFWFTLKYLSRSKYIQSSRSHHFSCHRTKFHFTIVTSRMLEMKNVQHCPCWFSFNFCAFRIAFIILSSTPDGLTHTVCYRLYPQWSVKKTKCFSGNVCRPPRLLRERERHSQSLWENQRHIVKERESNDERQTE